MLYQISLFYLSIQYQLNYKKTRFFFRNDQFLIIYPTLLKLFSFNRSREKWNHGFPNPKECLVHSDSRIEINIIIIVIININFL